MNTNRNRCFRAVVDASGTGRAHSRRAFLSLDVIAAISLGVVISITFALAVRHAVQISDECDARRVLRLAAETELNRLRAGLPRSDSPARDDCYIAVTLSPGEGEWYGFQHARIVAGKQAKRGRWIRVELSAYVEAMP